ncbi:HAD family hydrolase [Leptolyngbyaceae cyanobacterium CCMR0082]|uniref:HAD family hydrolase n=2 Tax=Adonisia TaxID=2950183 RepID=A0A6M0S9D9_9CYAN|nr:HAD family hydrolase [Adonisia turfae CCMR0082]
MMGDKPKIAVFDFDGTLTTQDSFVPFLRWTHGWRRLVIGLMRHSSAVLSYGMKRCSNQTIKEILLTEFYKGWSIERLKTAAADYAHHYLPKLVDPDALERLHWHQRQGHQIILVSATLEIYLQPWMKTLPIDHLLATRLEHQGGSVTGKLSGENCYGPEKVKRLERLLGDLQQYYIYAYGDGQGDRELLEAANEPYYRFFNRGRYLMIR